MSDEKVIFWGTERSAFEGVSGYLQRVKETLLKAVGDHNDDTLTLAQKAVTRIDKDGDVIYCLKQRLSRYEKVD